MPQDRYSADGGVEALKGSRGVWALKSPRRYFSDRIVKPRRNALRDRAISGDWLERRAANVVGTILERIVYQRLVTIWGPPDQAFIYKYNIGAVSGTKDARAFAGGVEMDFVILHRPSARELDLEIQGAHWHGPKDEASDIEKALQIMKTGRDYAEIWEYEVMLGDDYLDRRLLQIIGAQQAVAGRNTKRGVRTFQREVVGEIVRQT